MAKAWRGGEMPAPLDGRRRRQAARALRRARARPSATRPFVADMQRAGPAARRARPLAARAGPGRAHRHVEGRGRCPGCAPSSPPRTCPASGGTASSTTTGRASWPRARRCAASATSSPRWRPTTRAPRAQAAALVEVEYEPLPPVLDPEAALAPGAPQVNPKHPNLLSRSVIRRGDAAAALAASAHVVTGTWRTQRIEHLFLEPEAALAEPLPDGRLALYTQGQGVFDDRRQVAALPRRAGGARPRGAGAERRRLRRQGGHVGPGADGAPRARHRPAGQAGPRRARSRSGCTRSATPSGSTTRWAATPRGGSRRSWRGSSATRAPTPRSAARCSSARPATPAAPYRVPRGRRRGARRLHEQPALRRHARLRRAAGGVRHRGLPRPAREEGRPRRLGDPQPQRACGVGDAVTTGQVLEKSVGLAQDARRGEGRLLRRAPRRGRRSGSPAASRTAASATASPSGASAGWWSRRTARVSLYNGYTEMGQGLLTVLVQFAVEVTGLPASVFRPKVDSTFALGCGQTTGSRATLFGGRAVTSAARKLRADLDAGRRARRPRRPRLRRRTRSSTTPRPSARTCRRSRPTPSYGFATQVVILDDDGPRRARGRRARRGPGGEPARSAAGRSRAPSTWGSATRSPRSCPARTGCR